MIAKKIALGTAQFGLTYGVANRSGQTTLAEANKIISFARRSGIKTLDTAIAYGSSECVLGESGVADFRVVSKLPKVPENTRDVKEWVMGQIRASLERLSVESLYALLLHRSEDLLGPLGFEIVRSLEAEIDEGRVQKIGVSVYEPQELADVLGRRRIDLVQCPLNVVDRRFELSGWLRRLKDSGVEIHTRSAFLQGLLLMERGKIPEKFSRWSNLWDQWQHKLKVSMISPLAASLAYPLSLKQVDQVIVGVDSALQLSEILQAAEDASDGPDTSFMHSSDLDLINPSNWNHL